MRTYILLFSFFVNSVALAQHNFSFHIGNNYPINYSYSELIRKFGEEIGFVYSFNINKNLFVETGLVSRIHGRKNIELEGISEIGEIGDTSGVNYYEIKYEGKYSYLDTEFYLPLFFGYYLSNFNFEVKTGIIFSSTIYSFSDYNGCDPELLKQPLPKHLKRNYLSYGINLSYLLLDRTKIFLSISSPFNNSLPYYGLISLGLNYKISNAN